MRKIFCIVMLFLLAGNSSLYAKVLIITHNYNAPEFIPCQAQLFKHFLLDEFEYVVFNDAPDETIARTIEAACKQNHVRCIRIPQEIHTRPYLHREPSEPLHRPDVRHANAFQYSLDVLGFDHDDIVFIIDSDMFLIRPFSIKKYMENVDIAGEAPRFCWGSAPVRYVWTGLCLFNMPRLPDKRTICVNSGFIYGQRVDSGGYLHYYLEKHPEVIIKSMPGFAPGWAFFCPHRGTINHPNYYVPQEEQLRSLRQQGFSEKEITFFQKKPDTIELHFDKHFIHYVGGSNYDNLPAHYNQNKMKLFCEFFNDICNV